MLCNFIFSQGDAETPPNAGLPGIVSFERSDIKVGTYCLTSEPSKCSKLFYYVVKVVSIEKDLFKGEWYSFANDKKSFVKKDAMWALAFGQILSIVNAPEVITASTKRKAIIMFRDVYRFLFNKEYIKK